MLNMLNGCRGLTKIDLSRFDTSNVTNMNSMFFDCRALTGLDISNFNTINVINWNYMFSNIPVTVQITTNQSTKDWILDKFPSYKNITVVE